MLDQVRGRLRGMSGPALRKARRALVQEKVALWQAWAALWPVSGAKAADRMMRVRSCIRRIDALLIVRHRRRRDRRATKAAS